MSKHRIHAKRRKEDYEEELSDESTESSELDSEEEEDDDHHRKHHKRHREANDVRNLFIDEAEAVDEDEEEEEDADGYDADLLGPEEDEALQSAALTSARDLEARNRMKEFAEQDEESLERYFKQRYDAQESASHRFGEGAAMTANIVQQQNVPDIKDPNLWLVKCQMGEEKATVLSLMRKFFALQTTNPLQIKSAFAKEGLKGYIYIEAFKQTHVKQAIEGISALSRATYEQKLVPIGEMIDVMRVVKETASLKPKQWVRLKSGLYKDDLAQVESVEDAQNVVWLKLVPRIDYERRRGRFGKPIEPVSADPEAEPQRKQRFKRPPAALFDPSKVADRITSQSGGFTVFEGNQYDPAGFLRKDFRMNLVTADGVRPTLAELERFNQLPDGVAASRSLAAAAASNSSGDLGAAGDAVVGHYLMLGDVVEVCEGELRNLRGSVISVEAGTATTVSRVIVQPSHHDLKEPIAFAPAELRKYFAQGDHVRVLRGRYEGETGLVLAYDSVGGTGASGGGGGGGICTILPDNGISEIRVAPRDLRLWSDRGVGGTSTAASAASSSGIDGVERAKLMDFVQLDAQNYGVVINVDRESVRVLTCLGKVANVAANTALRVVKFGGPRGGISPQAMDREGNIIQVKDSVRFLEKPYAGIVGEIRYIFRSWVFVYCRTHAENSGMLVSKSRQLAKVGGGSGGAESGDGQQSRPPPPAVQRVNGPGGFRRGGGTGKDSLFADRALIGKTARIVAGTLKGLTGIICDVSAHDVYVELHSQFKKVHVLRQNVALLDSAGNVVESKLGGTPVPSTPRSMHAGAATPFREPRTPMVGSMTPYVSSMTPRADATPLPYAFNANMATPAHYASSSVYGSESELDGGGDPVGGQSSSARTPAYQTPAWHTPDPHRTGLGSLATTPRADHADDDDDEDD